jgi:hypothetical protein
MPIKDDWTKTLGDAKKVLGNSAQIKLGKIQAAIKSVDDGNKLGPGVNAARDALEKKIVEFQTAASKIQHSLDAADDEISDDDYGLDDSKPDDKKKIQQAQDLFKKFFARSTKEITDLIKTTDDLNKHVIQMQKYKGMG